MTTAPYGTWRSPITSDLIVAQSIGLSEIRIENGVVYWAEARPQEAGRTVIVRRGPDGAAADLTPRPFNARTRVHEYGGGAWCVHEGVLYASNFADQRLYRFREGREPEAVTPEGPWRYADGFIDARRGVWVGVREDHSGAPAEPVNTIVRLRLDGGDAGEVIAQGHDFFSSPRLSDDGRWLAYIAWDHPRMPWVGTTLYVMDLDAAGDPVAIAGGPAESIFQPEWGPGGELFFVSDRTGWWNLYRCAWPSREIRAIAPKEAEFGEPQWVFGMSTYAFAGERLISAYESNGRGWLASFDLPFTEFSSVRAEGDRVVFRGGAPDRPGSFVLLDATTGKFEVLRQANTVADDPEVRKYFSSPEQVEFPTQKGRTAFGLYYAPRNPDFTAPEGERPPLLVKVHGGPTASASSGLNLAIQYWTSRGIAVLDVNYGGSTGYGRAYRERLNGEWGVVDVEDCVNGARYLAERGMADGARCVISGGSAGGYTVLAALAFHDHFRGGASYYGVSDLAALTKDSHKFEARYSDALIGPYPQREDLYMARSPLFHVEGLNAPVIFFQGDEDRVVPPDQSERMVEALRAKGLPVGYLLFHGEQHGFRRAETIKRSLDAELYFYAVNVFRVALNF